MIAQSPAVPMPSQTTTAPRASVQSRRGLFGALAALFTEAARAEATSSSTPSERYWTSVSRGL